MQAQEQVRERDQVQEQVRVSAQALAQERDQEQVRVLARSPYRSKEDQALPCCRDRLQSDRRVLYSGQGRTVLYSSRFLELDQAQIGKLAHPSRPALALRPFHSRA